MKKHKRNLGFPDVRFLPPDDRRMSLEILSDIHSYNPFLVSSDHTWIDDLYKEVYPLAVSRMHRYTCGTIIANLVLRKGPLAINISKQSYRDTNIPSELVPSALSDICHTLHKKGYLLLKRGQKVEGEFSVPTEIEPTEKLLALVPKDYRTEISHDGLIQIKGFAPTTIPEEIEETRQLLKRYNRTVESENMLYASFKDGFDVNGRFHGSKVCVMPKEDRKKLSINGECVVEVDIQNCMPFLLYASELTKKIAGDFYDLPGVSRQAAKMAVMMALNCSSKRQARGALQAELNGLGYSETLKASEILNILERTHPDLAKYFYKGIGTKLMRLESRCMERFLGRMLELEIKVYPIYDSVVAPASKKEIVAEEFKKAFTVNGIEPTIHFE